MMHALRDLVLPLRGSRQHAEAAVARALVAELPGHVHGFAVGPAVREVVGVKVGRDAALRPPEPAVQLLAGAADRRLSRRRRVPEPVAAAEHPLEPAEHGRVRKHPAERLAVGLRQL